MRTILTEGLDEEVPIDGLKGLCDVNLEDNIATMRFLVQEIKNFRN